MLSSINVIIYLNYCTILRTKSITSYVLYYVKYHKKLVDTMIYKKKKYKLGNCFIIKIKTLFVTKVNKFDWSYLNKCR